ncbi:MAG: helix-turn-helix domain-containing protein [Pseudomonadota bacterium]|nr:helix-turn-helix domain-containing protein [Pseudomonadota bacterium]
MDPLLIFGIELGQWRRRNRLSPAALGARLGVSAYSIARIETGQQNVSLPVYSRLPEEMKARYRELCGEPMPSSENGSRRSFNAFPNQVKRRKCLGCPSSFTSKHYGNRFCHACGDRIKREDLWDSHSIRAARRTSGGAL